ncbi:MAG: tRNA (N(6)-L-threonylcarbamoyladenosine(37)-C(2))-methylthiotransferase MtaB [Bacteroidaceae bacterium]|nr:tRNA (N(6)-L-threonylcarbamoyladenosine(37)-C(2))-methylthiotransferase MtaB [Bacteroidaceae bacterium]
MADNDSILYNARVRTQTLGCKLNFAETAALADTLVEAGARLAEAGAAADICIVNTCSVTDTADHKCRQAIHRLRRANPSALLVVMGCYAQLRPDDVARIEGVGLVIGTEQKAQAAGLITQAYSRHRSGENAPMRHTSPLGTIRTFAPSCSRGSRTRYFLKVQDGCDYFCTYCTIPYARGRSRSARIADVVAQARQVAERGGKEIVLTGVNTGDFGRATGESFLQLLRELDGVEGIARYRISSIEPNLLTQDVIDFCAHSRAFMPHFHIPLQSGSDTVLRLMRRRYDTDFFRRKIAAVHEALPDAFVGIDVIVGTRGETAELFDETARFLDSLDFAQLHVFSYSERAGTKALEIPHVVAPAEKHTRSQQLLDLSSRRLAAFYARHVGTVRPVLWEQGARPDQPQQGFTDNYIRVELLPAQPRRAENELRAETLAAPLANGHLGVG